MAISETVIWISNAFFSPNSHARDTKDVVGGESNVVICCRAEKEKQQMKVELDDIRTQLEHAAKTRARWHNASFKNTWDWLFLIPTMFAYF